jgi:hypothetical protein
LKKIVEILSKNNVLCKKLNKIELNTRKKIDAFLGINIKNEYCFVAVFYKKSRFLNKDLEFLYEIMPDINFRYKKKILILNGEICSKTKEKMKDWRIFWF